MYGTSAMNHHKNFSNVEVQPEMTINQSFLAEEVSNSLSTVTSKSNLSKIKTGRKIEPIDLVKQAEARAKFQRNEEASNW